MKHRSRDTRRGLTVVEVAISTLLVGIVIVSALSLLGAAVRTHSAMNDLLDGPMLAEQLLAEIVALPYEDPEDGYTTFGPESDEGSGSRENWDDVDDFHGWSSSPPRDRSDVALTGFTGWTREATVIWSNPYSGTELGFDLCEKRIEVVVTSPAGDVTTRIAFRTLWGALEQPPNVDSTIVTRLESSLELGSGGARADCSSNLLNHVSDPNAN